MDTATGFGVSVPPELDVPPAYHPPFWVEAKVGLPPGYSPPLPPPPAELPPVSPHMVRYLVDRIVSQNEEIQKKNVKIRALLSERDTLLEQLAVFKKERVTDATLFDLLDLYHQNR